MFYKFRVLEQKKHSALHEMIIKYLEENKLNKLKQIITESMKRAYREKTEPEQKPGYGLSCSV